MYKIDGAVQCVVGYWRLFRSRLITSVCVGGGGGMAVHVLRFASVLLNPGYDLGYAV